MSSDLEHILVTRFNLPSRGTVETLVRAKEGWLRERVRLFERYCLPSVRTQSEPRFHWIVYIDPLSPAWFMEWVHATSADGVFHPVARAEVSREDLLGDIARVTGGPPRRLITTNLDNDDALAVDFVARVRAAAADGARMAIFLSRGLIASPSGLYLRTDRHNAFCSVDEPWDGAVTCWVDWHNRLPLHMATREIGGEPGWLQVVHGTNVSNRVRGRRVSPAPYRGTFPALLDDLHDPSHGQLLADRLLHGPQRLARESVRAGLKTVGVSVLGRDGLDRTKDAVAAVRAKVSRRGDGLNQVHPEDRGKSDVDGVRLGH